MFVMGIVGVGLAFWSPPASQAQVNPYAAIAGPDDWTAETPVKIFNRQQMVWQEKSYGEVEPDTEFIVGDYLYATTPTDGRLYLKPEIDITQLTETDSAFDPENWRIPEPDDVVFLYKSPFDQQQKGHWLLKHVQPGSEIIFQGKVWRWELDTPHQRMAIIDTGNVFARVTATHQESHHDDVLVLTVEYSLCGKQGVITGSEEHPFYVLDIEDYIPMVELEPGMTLKTDTDALATVIEIEPLSETMEMYNLTIDHVSNYYIFPNEDTPGVLVHNTNCGTPIWTPGKPGDPVQNALEHWQNHRSEFPEFVNAKQYVEGTWDFITNPPSVLCNINNLNILQFQSS